MKMENRELAKKYITYMNFELENSRSIKPWGYHLLKENCEQRYYFILTCKTDISSYYEKHGDLKKLKIDDVGESTKLILEIILDDNIDFDFINKMELLKKKPEVEVREFTGNEIDNMIKVIEGR